MQFWSSSPLLLIMVTLGVLIEGHAVRAETCALERVASMPMTLDQANWLRVPALFNGKDKGAMLIDTGAFTSLLRRSVVTELRLPERKLSEGVHGAGGRPLTTGVVVDLQLDKLVARNSILVVAPDRVFMDGQAGLIGEDYFVNYDLDLDFEGNKVNLFSQDHCPGQVVYWAKNFIQIPFTLNDGNEIIVSVTLDGRALKAVLDTGASKTFLGLLAARREFNLNTDSPGIISDAAASTADGVKLTAYRYHFHKLEIGGITFRNPELVLIPTPRIGHAPIGTHIDPTLGERPEVTLGMAELSKLHLYIAYGERMLYVTPIGPEP
jgi:hypothetical protein